MEFKDVFPRLRQEKGLSQEAVAERVFVTRQAVSRWENGETLPSVETLRRLSALFDVSINTLLGAPCSLICQRCGMPLNDAVMCREPDGSFNESYCKWCRSEGKFPDQSLEELIDFLVAQYFVPTWSDEQARAFYAESLPKLDYWRARG